MSCREHGQRYQNHSAWPWTEPGWPRHKVRKCRITVLSPRNQHAIIACQLFSNKRRPLAAQDGSPSAEWFSRSPGSLGRRLHHVGPGRMKTASFSLQMGSLPGAPASLCFPRETARAQSSCWQPRLSCPCVGVKGWGAARGCGTCGVPCRAAPSPAPPSPPQCQEQREPLTPAGHLLCHLVVDVRREFRVPCLP